MEIKFKRCNLNAVLPQANRDGDIGFDLSSIEELLLAPHSTTKVSTGLQLADYPTGTNSFLKIESRSGLALKGVWAVGGIVDPNYRGMVDVILYNSTNEYVKIDIKQRIAQLVVYHVSSSEGLKFTETETVSETIRGGAGFGSSGA